MKHLIYYLLYVGILISCQPSNKVEENKSIGNNIQLLNNLMVLWETGDTIKTIEIFSENCEYTDVANNTTLSGIEGVNRYISHVHNWASNTHMTVRKINASENIGYVEWIFTAVQSSPIKGRVPIATNKNITLNGVTVVEFKDGKIQKAADYMDVLGFVIQLGSKIELPGGVIIGE
jgi:steroid delta-isomerase-like uncharacterized protein